MGAVARRQPVGCVLDLARVSVRVRVRVRARARVRVRVRVLVGVGDGFRVRVRVRVTARVRARVRARARVKGASSTTHGALKSLMPPKSSAVSTRRPSLERCAALMSLPSEPSGHTPSTEKPRTPG